MQESKFSIEDAASITNVLGMLEDEAARLSNTSKVAGVWSDWAELLRPTAVEAGAAPAQV